MHVDFFIAGVQKSATTALDKMLRRHPAIEMAAVKEPHFFDNETLDWSAPDYGLLHSLYESAPIARLRGEATPIYTYWPNSIERLAAYNPRAKLIVGLRHPAYRAFSHWRMETTRAADDMPFADAIRDGRQRVAQSPTGAHRVYSYVERGFYAPQFERIFAHFARHQVHIFRTDALWSAPEQTLSEVLATLNAPSAELTHGPEYIVPLQSNEAVMSDQDLDYLLDLFAADIETTAQLSGLDLNDWLRRDYCEPMAPVG